ncbi:ABC transporter ATP-binding protein, partial [Variovorax sp. CT11-76]
MTLEARALCAFHGRIPALHEVDVSVPPSGIVTVVGPNGAGKSTLLAALMGRLPMSGEVRLDGTDLRFVSPERRVAMGLALVPEQRDLFGTLSVADNLELGAFCWRRAGRRAIAAEMERVYALFPRLGERHAQLAHTLSGGERQMLALGRALMARPRIL